MDIQEALKQGATVIQCADTTAVISSKCITPKGAATPIFIYRVAVEIDSKQAMCAAILSEEDCDLFVQSLYHKAAVHATARPELVERIIAVTSKVFDKAIHRHDNAHTVIETLEYFIALGKEEDALTAKLLAACPEHTQKTAPANAPVH